VGAAGKKRGKQKKKDGGRKKVSSPKISKKMSKAGEEEDEEGEEDEAGGEVGDGEMDEDEERLRAQIHETIDQWTPVLIQRVCERQWAGAFFLPQIYANLKYN
jgi:hypothetical protein